MTEDGTVERSVQKTDDGTTEGFNAVDEGHYI